MSRTVSLATLGCKTNQFESAAIEQTLRDAGYSVVPFEEGADLVIVNTCTVTAATDSQSRNLIRRARRLNLDCRVVVTGCYAQIDPEVIRAIPGVAVVLGNDEKKDFLRYLEADDGEQQVSVSDIRNATEAVPLSLSSFAERSRAFVQIQNGCDAFCAYCIIPYARGSSRSLPPQQVLEQIRRLAEAGHEEIVLTGIHVGCYGADLNPSLTLTELVQDIEGLGLTRRLRLGSLEPLEIPPELIDLVASSPMLCRHFHIPLQAGDDQVLTGMNRHYTTGFFEDLVERIHRRLPDAAIGLDVIAGFPGETEEQFENTCRLIEALPISHLHVFPFSRRPGTPAADMPAQIGGAEVKARAARLRAIGEQKHFRFARQFIGQTLEVVVEGGSVGKLRRGLSRNYLTVLFEGGQGREGECIDVQISEWTPAGLRGKIVPAI